MSAEMCQQNICMDRKISPTKQAEPPDGVSRSVWPWYLQQWKWSCRWTGGMSPVNSCVYVVFGLVSISTHVWQNTIQQTKLLHPCFWPNSTNKQKTGQTRPWDEVACKDWQVSPVNFGLHHVIYGYDIYLHEHHRTWFNTMTGHDLIHAKSLSK